MRKSFAAFAFAVFALAQPASAITFSKLTTIYVGSGVYDDGQVGGAGDATSIHCSNVSGAAVQVRALVLDSDGAIAGVRTATLQHGATFTFSTHSTVVFTDEAGLLNTGFVQQGVVNIEATNSAVFCTADRVDAENTRPIFMAPLHLVRINPHPGTVE
jgi:hypothetical protein